MANIPVDHSLKHKIALLLLPIKGCCGKGCKKCNFGRWKKHRPRTVTTLLDEIIHRIPVWLWCVVAMAAYFTGALVHG